MAVKYERIKESWKTFLTIAVRWRRRQVIFQCFSTVFEVSLEDDRRTIIGPWEQHDAIYWLIPESEHFSKMSYTCHNPFLSRRSKSTIREEISFIKTNLWLNDNPICSHSPNFSFVYFFCHFVQIVDSLSKLG